MVSGSSEVLGVQEKLPELGMLSASVSMGTTLVLGPRRSTSETGPVVVGSHVIVYGLPAGTNSFRPGLRMAFPVGSWV